LQRSTKEVSKLVAISKTSKSNCRVLIKKYNVQVEWKGEKWIELNRVLVSPYVHALSSEVEKNPASIAASEKKS